MLSHTVGLWLYQNSGGERIQAQIVKQLRDRGISSITDLNLNHAIARNGAILCNNVIMEELDLFFSYNAGHQTAYQVYLYQTLSHSIPLLNNFEAFSLTEDKFRTSHKLRRHGIRTPDYRLCNSKKLSALKSTVHEWDGQLVYKPTDGWGGCGIVKLESKHALDMIEPFLNKNSQQHFYIERLIDYDNTDYRIDIVDNECVSCYGRKAAYNNWKTNISSGGSIILREPNSEVIKLAKKAATITGLEIAGVDLLYDRKHEEYVVLEVNGIPAFATPEQEKIGLNFNQKKINKIVDLIERKVTFGKNDNLIEVKKSACI